MQKKSYGNFLSYALPAAMLAELTRVAAKKRKIRDGILA